MKRAAAVAAIAALAAAIWYLNRSAASTAAAPPAPPPRTTERPPAARSAPIAKVTKIDAEQRNQLADRIAAAHASRTATTEAPRAGAAATHAPAPPSLPGDDAIDPTLEPLRVELKTAMREVIPILTECYEASMADIAEPETKIVAELTLTGDPDVGTLIDAAALTDHPDLPPAFDDCLRSTFQTLALPPLAEGDEVLVHYPFTFAKN